MILKSGNHQGRKYWSIERVGYAGQVILEIPDILIIRLYIKWCVGKHTLQILKQMARIKLYI